MPALPKHGSVRCTRSFFFQWAGAPFLKVRRCEGDEGAMPGAAQPTPIKTTPLAMCLRLGRRRRARHGRGPSQRGSLWPHPRGAGLAWRGQDGPPASWIFLAPPPGTGEHSLARRGARSPSPPVASRKPRPAVGRALSAGLLVLATSSFDKPSAQAPRRNRKHAPGFVGARSVSVAAVPCFHVSLGTSRGEAVRFLEDRV